MVEEEQQPELIYKARVFTRPRGRMRNLTVLACEVAGINRTENKKRCV
jgi:hypothetical protein